MAGRAELPIKNGSFNGHKSSNRTKILEVPASQQNLIPSLYPFMNRQGQPSGNPGGMRWIYLCWGAFLGAPWRQQNWRYDRQEWWVEWLKQQCWGFSWIFWILGSGHHPHLPIQHDAERFKRISDITGWQRQKQRSCLIIFPKLCNVKNYAWIG
jgi:hypothetical protein